MSVASDAVMFVGIEWTAAGALASLLLLMTACCIAACLLHARGIDSRALLLLGLVAVGVCVFHLLIAIELLGQPGRGWRFGRMGSGDALSVLIHLAPALGVTSLYAVLSRRRDR